MSSQQTSQDESTAVISSQAWRDEKRHPELLGRWTAVPCSESHELTLSAMIRLAHEHGGASAVLQDALGREPSADEISTYLSDKDPSLIPSLAEFGAGAQTMESMDNVKKEVVAAAFDLPDSEAGRAMQATIDRAPWFGIYTVQGFEAYKTAWRADIKALLDAFKKPASEGPPAPSDPSSSGGTKPSSGGAGGSQSLQQRTLKTLTSLY